MKALLCVVLCSIAACGRPSHPSERPNSVGPTITERPAERSGNPPPPAVIVGAGDSPAVLSAPFTTYSDHADAPAGRPPGEPQSSAPVGLLLGGSVLTLLGILASRGRGANTKRPAAVPFGATPQSSPRSDARPTP